jgi:uncharacterized protein YigE (DUF2233 family)
VSRGRAATRSLALWFVAAAGTGSVPAAAQGAPLPPSSLAVWTGNRWQEWWHSAAAPTYWATPVTAIVNALHWQASAPGVEWTDLRLRGSGEAWRIRLIVARLDPRLVRFRLDTASRDGGSHPAWTIERARPEALFAINAGQFPQTLPWGWVVLDGRQYLAPGAGPLSVGVAFDSTGAVRWIPADSLDTPVARRGVAAAFQSYPVLLTDGTVPLPLRAPGEAINLTHRDARAALGQVADGRILAVVSRFDGANGVLDFVPFGLTTPEMAAVMGALGARNAVMLDGGISSQLLIRDAGEIRRWRGLREVPLALVAVPRT